MNLVDEQRRALVEIRRVLADFVRGDSSVAEFVPHYRSLFAPFDPPDLAVRDLTDAEKSEVDVLIQIMGGWFREYDALIPKDPAWRYGTSMEPYSWIDGPAYRSWIRAQLTRAGIDV